ncbi:nitrate reductase molybdenum cofactor assembly chaperone [Cellulomonas hominis]|uniref:nitrate reductase molybdenum cofactor assembly chaperone n=1 Tax=Cellulomonas hominis TaxID=156981 RepID=UPI001C0FFFB4|nr:nitrate reductase molybdenum cofactor assembly chaperone [Cellulomonas hominis]MBU5422186.1 nitrate reductase molybdenum cofactor assembly chaperone [Cellulomonas hominis]
MTAVRVPLLRRSRRRDVPEIPARADVLALCSVLLGYPDDDLYALADDLAASVRDLPASEPAEHLRAFWESFAAQTPAEARAAYVEAFDLRRSSALYLSYYLHGDTRRRGAALLAIKQRYRACGFTPPEDELPDHLPLVLEFAAYAGTALGEGVLRSHRAGIELIRRALADRRSPYARVLDALDALLGPAPAASHAAVDAFTLAGAPTDTVGAEITLAPYGPGWSTDDAACPTPSGGR